MTREEQIKQAADEYMQTFKSGPRGSFINGAEWADQHPHWIPVEERLPKRMREGSRFSETVLVYNKAGFIDTTYYDYEENEWKWSPSVTHWMKIVPPRKEE